MKNDETRADAYLPDEEIVDLYWKRNEKAIKETDKKYGKYLFTIAYNIVHDRLDCEECVNDTYLGTWNKIPPSKPNVLQAFLSKIMRNIAVDKYRAKSASKHIPSELMVSLDELDDCLAYSSSVEEEYVVSEVAKILNTYLRELTERREFVFICRYYYSDQLETIAKMLNTSRSTVCRELAEIRKELKERLEREGYFYE